METNKFQELILSQLTNLTEDMSDLRQDVTGLKDKLDLVYDHVVRLTATQTTNEKRITKVEQDTVSLAELYGKHEVEIKRIKNAIL